MKYFEVQFTTLKEQHNVFLTLSFRLLFAQIIVIKCSNDCGVIGF